jgi:hypothetical protein
VINTLRNSGHKLNLSYFVDESFVKADEESVKAFVKTQPGLYDYDLAARFVILLKHVFVVLVKSTL